QLHQPARRPGHHLRQPHPTGRRHATIHHHHQPHPAATPSLRTARRLTPPRLHVVSNPHPTNHKTPGQCSKLSTKQGELRFSVETAGRFDPDAELELWFSGRGRAHLDFKGQV